MIEYSFRGQERHDPGAALEPFETRSYGATPVPMLADSAGVAAGLVRAGNPDLLVAQVDGGLVGVVRAPSERSIELPADLADQTIDGAWNLLARTSPPSA